MEGYVWVINKKRGGRRQSILYSGQANYIMDNYERVSSVLEERPETTSATGVTMAIKTHGKIKNYVQFALTQLAIVEGSASTTATDNIDNEPITSTDGNYRSNTDSTTQQQVSPSGKVVLCGYGPAVAKTISVCEIIKRRVPDAVNVTQSTSVHYERIVERWLPKDKDSGLDSLEAVRKVPAIRIELMNSDYNNINDNNNSIETTDVKTKKKSHQQQQTRKAGPREWKAQKGRKTHWDDSGMKQKNPKNNRNKARQSHAASVIAK